ncbi:MAG: TolC family protein [Planctomycetota bacterium]
MSLRNFLFYFCVAGVVTFSGCLKSLIRNECEPVPLQKKWDLPIVEAECAEVEPCHNNIQFTVSPRTIGDGLPQVMQDVTLGEVINKALENPKVLRSLGAQVLTNPTGIATRFDPAIQESNPIFGIEGALSQFDAQFSSSLNYQKNDDVFNNILNGGGANEVRQDLVTGQFALNKTAATGTRLSLRGSASHDDNNRPQNLFNHSWNSFWEAELRQPLLQGSGVTFNRIAGPNAQPGFRFSNGVLISRINNDITVADFERGVRDFVAEVTSAYWQLYFTYKNYEAIEQTRDAALETWQIVKARFEKELPGGEKDRETQAREQYYQFQQSLVVALNGNRVTGQPGVLQSEANLRRLIGLPQSGHEFLRPIESPYQAMIVYDWNDLVHKALNQRVELRQQKWRIKQRELELLASKNFTLPRLDIVGTYRNNGFGDDLLGGGSGRFASALKDLASGDHQEFAFGVEYNLPVGFRQAHSGVRHAELNLNRERAVLEDQEQQILHDLGSAYRQIEASHSELTFALNRMKAAMETVEARNAIYERDLVALDVLLESQRRLNEATVAYHRSTTDYMLSNIEVYRQSGTLLNSYGIFLNEEQPFVPTTDDQKHWLHREQARKIDYRQSFPGPVSKS